MSETTTTTKPKTNDSPATQATSTASNAAAGALAVIVIWALSATHVTVPPEVAAAFTVLAGALVHWLVIKYGVPNTP